MSKPKTIEFRFERTIPAPPGEVFEAWLKWNSRGFALLSSENASD
jgi:hypothetical protein